MAIDAVDAEDVGEGFARAVALGCPVRADEGELESDDGGWVHGDVQVAGLDLGYGDAFFVGDAGEGVQGRAEAGFADDVVFPGWVGGAIGAEEVGFVLWVVAEAEFGVGHCEEGWREGFVIGLAFAADVAGTPAGVNEFPFAVVDFDGVPRVALGHRGDGRAWREGGEAVAFSVAADDDGFEAGFGGYGGEEAGIAFANGEAGGKGFGRGGGFDGVVEEGDDIVRDVVMKPGEDRSGFVCCRREGTRQLVREPVDRGDGFTREFSSMSVRTREVSTMQA